MANEYVVDGAQLKCSFGVAPSVLTILPQHCVELTGKFKANIDDCIGLVNIATFGTSIATPPSKPCVPECVSWIGGKANLLIDGSPALLDINNVVCSTGGGLISITDSGQGDAMQRLVDFYEAAHPDHKTLMDEFLRDIIANGSYDEDVKNIKYMMYYAKEPYKTVMFEYLPNLSIGSFTDSSQRYSSSLNQMFVSLNSSNNEGSTDPRGPYVSFFHELGHGIDDQMRKAGVFDQSSSGLQNILSNDSFRGIEDTTRSFSSDPAVVSAVVDSFRDGGAPVAPGSPEAAIRNMVINEYRNNLTNGGVTSAQTNQITDVLGGYTSNVLGGNLPTSGTAYSHQNSYWTDPARTNPQSSEFFAHNFSNNVTRNKAKVDLMNTYYPNGKEFIDTSLTEVAKNLGNGGN